MLKKAVLIAVLCVSLLLLGCNVDTICPTQPPKDTASPQSTASDRPGLTPTENITQAPILGSLVSLPLFSDISMDFDSNGTTEQMSFAANEEEVLTVTLQTADKDYSLTINGCQYQEQFTFTTVEGKTCVFIVYDMASSDYMTQMISFNGNALVCSQITGYITKAEKIEVVTGSNKQQNNWLTFMQPIDVFGTWITTVKYELTKDLAIESYNAYEFNNEATVTTKVELVAKKPNSQPQTIPAGSKLKLQNTDGKTFVKFIYDQKEYSFDIEFDEENYTFLVNGINQDDAFADLEYFG